MLKYFFILYFFSLPLFVTSQTADFSFQSSDGLFCNPATIQFTQNCTGNPTGFIWYLGNGLTNNIANPTTSYTNGGTYTVKLIAIYPQTTLEVSKTIVISPTIQPTISLDRNYICQPGVINFSASGNGNINKYDWDFGDTSGLVSTPTNTTSHSYTRYGTHVVLLTATDTKGCFGQDTITIQVKKIPLTAATDPSSGCIPANVSFTSDVELPLNSTISSYSWNFGDGNPPSSTTSGALNHSYIKVGKFSPKLTVTSSEGCTTTFNFPQVAFGTPPINHIAYPKKTVVCGSESPVFVAKATNANSYFWDFGDDSTASVTDTVTEHKYKTLGIKTVKVTPYFNDCPGVTKTFQIEVIGVIAKYNFSNTCNDKRSFTFRSLSLGNKSNYEWDFGDGNGDSGPNVTLTSHTFPVSGQFITTLKITDDITGCIDTFSRAIFTGNPVLVNPDVSVCRNDNTTFSISNNYNNPSAVYVWTVFGKRFNTDTVPTLTVTAVNFGSFDGLLEIRNPGYCFDTVLLDHSILVRGPDLNFTLPASICFGDVVNISNTSRPYVAADSVHLWYWNYGNSDSNDTTYQPASLLYVAPKSYLVNLTAIDINGCKDSLAQRVLVNPLPFLQVQQNIDTLCSGSADTLFAYHSDNILWSPANSLSCSTCDTVISRPTVTTQYFIKASTPFNCSIQDSIMVNVVQPFTAAPPLTNPFICLGDQVTLDMDPKNKIIVWSPAAGLSNITIYNPVAKPDQPTTYTATLTDSLGCFTRTADVTVAFKSVPAVDAGPDRVLQYNAPFTITPLYSNNVRSYLWAPSSLLNCSNCATPSGLAAYSETYNITVTSDSGCVATDSIRIAIECKEANILMPKAFTPNNDNLNDYYYPVTRGIKTIVKFDVYNRAGQILYEARNFLPNNKSFAWDGNYKGKRQSAEAYVYVLEALCEIGEKIVKSGSFLLLR